MFITRREYTILQAVFDYLRDDLDDLNNDLKYFYSDANPVADQEIKTLQDKLFQAIDERREVGLLPEETTPSPAEEKHLVFVYGTLKQEQRNNYFLAGQKFVGEAITSCNYRMYDNGYYPAVVADASDGDSIQGELWEVDAPTLERLDLVENVPTLYRREKVHVLCPAGQPSQPVWMYLYNKSVEGWRECGPRWPAQSALPVNEEAYDDADPNGMNEDDLEEDESPFAACPMLEVLAQNTGPVASSLLRDCILELTKIVQAQAKEIKRLGGMTHSRCEKVKHERQT